MLNRTIPALANTGLATGVLIASAVLFSGANGVLQAQEAQKPITRSVKVEGAGSSTEAAPELPQKPMVPHDNGAGLSIEILPRDHIEIGTKVLFKVTTQKPGYLILLDVDAHGRVTQIYPNLYSMANPGNASMVIPAGATAASNLLTSGKSMLIPDMNNPFARFEYVVEPPSGQGIIVALLSPKPVHMVDIPDVPSSITEGSAIVDYIYDAAKNLRLAEQDAELVDPQWSFEAKLYSITP
jgi:hypothetical protein